MRVIQAFGTFPYADVARQAEMDNNSLWMILHAFHDLGGAATGPRPSFVSPGRAAERCVKSRP